MNSVELAEILAPIVHDDKGRAREGRDQISTEALEVLRRVHNALVMQDAPEIHILVRAGMENVPYSPEYNKKHGLHPNTSLFHDGTYG